MSSADAHAPQIIDAGALGMTVPDNRWDLLPDPARPPTASVIIAFYEQHDELERVLAGLSVQRGPVVINEIIVVDDGSRWAPSVASTLPVGGAADRRCDVPVVVLRQEDCGKRPAAARNLGATRATGDVLVFFDGDTVPAPDAVARLAALPAVAPAAVVVGRREYCDFDAWPADAVASWLRDDDAPGPHRFDRPAWLDQGYATSANLLVIDDRSYQFVIGAIMATSRRFFSELGGFDASIDCYGGEDWEIAYRAWCAGALLAHVPDAIGYHHGPDWRGREGAAATKNSERLVLMRTIPGRHDAIRGPFARVVATVRGDAPDDAVIATIASLLQAGANQIVVNVERASPVVVDVVAPDARVSCVVVDPVVVARSIVQLDLHVPVALSHSTIDDLCRLILSPDHGRIVVTDPDGVLLVATATRAIARATRYAACFDGCVDAITSLFGTSTVSAEEIGVHRLRDRIDLERVFER